MDKERQSRRIEHSDRLMTPDRLPLDSFPLMRSKTVAGVHDVISPLFAARILNLPQGSNDLDARGNLRSLAKTKIWCSSYNVPIKMCFGGDGLLRLQFALNGSAAISAGGKEFQVTPQQGCVMPAEGPPIVADYERGFGQIVFLLETGHLREKLALLTGAAIKGPLEFAPTIDLTKPQAGFLRRMADSLVESIDVCQSPSSSFLPSELEQTLMVAFLYGNCHSHSHLLEGEPPGIAPRQVRRAEEYIEAQRNRPMSIEDIAFASGASVRSVYRLFKRSRGYSPMEFARQIRLRRAKQMLERPDVQTNVTGVAFACGFGDLGRFSKDYRSHFGERPSEALRRSKGT
jgi:AraC-like DNA-binding protein